MGDETSVEALLWQRALDGDGRAFASLFRTHRDRVLRASARLVVGRADAEDVASSAFFELWRRRHRVVLVDGSVLPWLLVTAQNLARNSNRSLARYRRLLDSLPPSPHAADPADVAAGRTRLTDLGLALRGLRPTEAALVSLVGVEGVSVSSAAALLGLAPGTARTRLYRSRLRLRAALGDSDPDPTPVTALTEGAAE